MVTTRKGYNLSKFKSPLDDNLKDALPKDPASAGFDATKSTIASQSQSMSNAATGTAKNPGLTAPGGLKPARDTGLDNINTNKPKATDITMDGLPNSMKIDAPDKVDPKTGKMYNADGTDYVAGPNSTMQGAGMNIGADINAMSNPTQSDNDYNTIITDISGKLGVTNPGDFETQYGDVFSNPVHRKTYDAIINDPRLNDSQKAMEVERFKNNILGAATSLQRTKQTLNMLDATDDAIRSKFANADEILDNKKNIEKLARAGKTNDQIAQELGKNPQEIQDYLLGNYGKYGTLTEAALAEDKGYQSILQQKEYLKSKYDLDQQQLEANRAEVKRQFDQNYAEQEQNNKKQQLGLAELSRRTGVTYTNTGLAGISEVNRQAKMVLDDMYANYKYNDVNLSRAIEQRTLAYQQGNKEVAQALSTTIDQIRNGFMGQIQQIRDKYGTVSQQGIAEQRAITEVILGQIDNAVNSAYAQRQQSLNMLMTETNYIRTQQEIYAKEQEKLVNDYVNNFDDKTYNDLLNEVKSGKLTPDLLDQIESGVKDSIIGTLNSMKGFESYMIGSRYVDQINKMYTEQGMSPQQIMAAILKDKEVAGIVQSVDGMLNPVTPTQDWTVNADGIRYNKRTGEWSTITPGSINNAPTQQSANFLSMPEGSVGGQCGYYANRATGLGDEPGGDDSIAGRMKTYTGTSPVAGGMVFFAGGGYDAKNGHVSVITKVNQDGSFEIKESNLKGDEKIGTRTIQANDPSLKGFYNNTPLAQANQGADGVDTSGTPKSINDLSGLTQQVLNGTMSIKDVPSADRAKVAQEISDSGQKILADKSVGFAKSTIDLISKIKDSDGFKGAVGRNIGQSRIPGTDAYNTRMQIDQLKSIITIPMLENMRGLGSMSEVEFNTMSRAATSLDRGMSEKDFIEELDEITNAMNVVLSRNNQSITGTPTPPPAGGSGGVSTKTQEYLDGF